MKHLIIGAGAAGVSAARTIRELRGDDEIVMISIDEGIYSRCMLQKLVSGERSEDELSFVPEGFFEDNNIRRISGVAVKGVDTERKLAHFDIRYGGASVGASESYDRLLIATGSVNVVPPVGDLRTADNVCGLRDISGAKEIREKAARAEDIVIIGAGLVGMNAAYALAEMGKKPVVVELAESIFAKYLDERASGAYKARFEEAGCSFLMGAKVDGTICDASGAVTAIVLEGGRRIPCDLVISAVAVVPAVAFLYNSGIACNLGVVVDEHLATSADGVYAAGDATGLSGVWPNAARQGETAAMNMCGVPTVYDDDFAQKNTMNFFDIVTFSLGQFVPAGGDVVMCRESRGTYEKVVLRDGVPVGVILQGDITHSGFWRYLLKNKISVAGISKPIWKLSYADFFGMEKNGEYRLPTPSS